MKKIRLLAAIFLLIAQALYTQPAKANPPSSGISFQVFYNDLSPYGSWVSYPGYGYAWIPREPGFVPYYTSGNWAYTGDSWLWVSNYPWGWAPFHYGSWQYDPFYGWLWIPGYYWAPAWVTWGYFDGYYGWAPVGPGFSMHAYHCPHIDYWHFVHPSHITSTRLHDYVYGPRDHRISFGSTTITDINKITVVKNVNRYNNREFYSGPSRQDVERTGKVNIASTTVQESANPGKTELSNNTVNVYRPRIMDDNKTAKPATVVPLENIKAENIKEQKINTVQKRAPANTEIKRVEPVKESPEVVRPKPATETENSKPPVKSNEPLPPDNFRQRMREVPSGATPAQKPMPHRPNTQPEKPRENK